MSRLLLYSAKKNKCLQRRMHLITRTISTINQIGNKAEYRCLPARYLELFKVKPHSTALLA